MREGEQRPYTIYTEGKGEKYQSTTPPEYFRAIFEQSWQQCLRQERTVRNEDGTTRTLVAYELTVDARDEAIRRDVLTRFGLDAAQAGYNQVLSPVVMPDIYSNDTQRLSAVYFYFEKPHGQASAQQATETVKEPAVPAAQQEKDEFAGIPLWSEQMLKYRAQDKQREAERAAKQHAQPDTEDTDTHTSR
jgi:hypothetical protein